MNVTQILILLLVGAVASAINTVAGGGSLISFPVLTLGLGMPSVPANATNTVGMWPGSLGGALGYLSLLKKAGHHLKLLWFPTLLGSQVGAYLLLHTSSHVFDVLVPPLILLAASLLAFQPKIKAWSARRSKKLHPGVGIVIQFFVSVYGGYFGAGMGIMMLAAFALYVDGDIHELNAVKNWLSVFINFSASVPFILSRLVDLRIAVWLIIGSVIGGYYSAKVSMKVDGNLLRKWIAVYGFCAAAYFFYKVIVKH